MEYTFCIKQVVVTPFTSQGAWLPIDLLYILNESTNLSITGFYITVFSLRLLQWNLLTQISKFLASTCQLTKPREECHTIHIQHEWEIVASNEEKLDGIRVAFAAKLKELVVSFASITYDYPVDKVFGNSMASKWTTMATTTFDHQINEFLTELSEKHAA